MFGRLLTIIITIQALCTAAQAGYLSDEQKKQVHRPAAFDMLGNGVAIQGDIAVAGAFRTGESDSGAAYVFVRRDGRWLQTQRIVPSDTADGQLFGRSVAISGDRLLISAVADSELGFAAGAAYVFRLEGDTWIEEAKLLASDGAAGDQAGWSVALNGDTAIVGAYLDDDMGPESGAAYVYTRTGQVWTEQQKLVAPDGEMDERFGLDVDVNGDTAVISAMVDDDLGPESGSAYVYTRTAGVWSLQQKLLASDGQADDRWAVAVEVQGDTIAIGGWRDDDLGFNSGSVYIFERVKGTWTEVQKINASDGSAGDEFGYDISINGDKLLVGAFSDDDLGATAGSAYLFRLVAGTWVEIEKILPSDGVAGDQFGVSVGLDGGSAVVGAWWNGASADNAGAAYFFTTDPDCGVETNRSSYTDNDVVWAVDLGLNLSDAADLGIEWKIWLAGPNGLANQLLNNGADSDAVFPAGWQSNLAPLPLFTVVPALPRGTYTLNCRLLDPLSGKTMDWRVSEFEIE